MKHEVERSPTEWRIVVSRKVARLATERNRWKRRLREVLREYKDAIRPGYWARLKVLRGGVAVSYSELKREVIELIKESGLWRR